MITYQVKANDKVIRNGKVSLDIAPQESQELTVNVNGLEPKVGTEYFVNFSVTTVEPEPLVPIGYELAHEQFRLPIEPVARTFATDGPALKCSTDGNLLKVSSSRLNFVFDKESGIVTSYKVKGTEYFDKLRHPAEFLACTERQRLRKSGTEAPADLETVQQGFPRRRGYSGHGR